MVLTGGGCSEPSEDKRKQVAAQHQQKEAPKNHPPLLLYVSREGKQSSALLQVRRVTVLRKGHWSGGAAAQCGEN